MLLSPGVEPRVVSETHVGKPTPGGHHVPSPTDVDVLCRSGGECLVHRVTELTRTISSLDLRSGELVELVRLPIAEGAGSEAFFWDVRDTEPKVVVTEPGQFHLISVAERKVVRTVPHPKPVKGVQFVQWGPAEGIYATVAMEMSLEIGHIDREGRLAKVGSGGDWSTYLRLSPDGGKLAWTEMKRECAPWKLTLE